MIKAKPIVPEQFWILQKDNNKIGTVDSNPDGFVINFKGRPSVHYTSLKSLKEDLDIEFLDALDQRSAMHDQTVYGFPVDEPKTVYNPLWDVKQKLPLFTKNEKSKSWFAAGWYHVKIKNKWKVHLCPKLIILQRNDYRGPFKDKP